MEKLEVAHVRFLCQRANGFSVNTTIVLLGHQ
jgi:hypothetical protein